MNKLSRYAAAVTIFALAGALVIVLYRQFSPHQICVRYYTFEATDSGQSIEAAREYAESLCARKNPLRN